MKIKVIMMQSMAMYLTIMNECFLFFEMAFIKFIAADPTWRNGLRRKLSLSIGAGSK